MPVDAPPGTDARPVTIGMVGAGMVGQLAHLANYATLPGCIVPALAELRPGLGGLAATRYGVARTYTDHHSLLEHETLDAVAVATRREATGPIVLDALAAGCHVFCEKPMAHTVDQGRKIVEAAAAAGREIAVGFMKRHDAGASLFMDLLTRLRASEELGRILFLRSWCYGGEFWCGDHGAVMTDERRPVGLETWPTAPDWVPSCRRDDYAWFLNVFVHDLNFLRYATGRTPQVTHADFSRPNGRTVSFDFGDFAGVLEMAEIPFPDWREGLELLFERGRLEISFPSPMRTNQPARVVLERANGDDSGGTALPEVPRSWAFRRQAAAFVEDVRTKRTPIASAKDSLEDLVLAERIWRAALA